VKRKDSPNTIVKAATVKIERIISILLFSGIISINFIVTTAILSSEIPISVFILVII